MKIICFMLPAFISLMIDICLNKKEKFNYTIILKYGIYNFLINYLVNIAVYIISSNKLGYYNELTFNYTFILKYSTVCLFLAIIIPIVGNVISKNVKLNIEVKEKRNESNKNN